MEPNPSPAADPSRDVVINPATPPPVRQFRRDRQRAGFSWYVDQAQWDASDVLMTERAAGRVAAGAAWLALAVAVGDGVVIGVMALVAHGLSLLHARRRTVLEVRAWLRRHSVRVGDAFSSFFPYPRRPHVNAVGIVEYLAIAAVGWETGWLGGAFREDALAAGLATVLVCLSLTSMFANIEAHVVYHVAPAPFDEPPSRFDELLERGQRLYAPALAAVAAVVLWPATSEPILQVLAVAGPLAAAGTSRAASMAMRARSRLTWALAEQIRSDTHRRDAAFVHAALKTRSRILLNAVGEAESSLLRSLIRQTAVATAATEAAMQSGSLRLPGSAGEIVAALADADASWARLRNCVVDDVAPDSLEEEDAELVFVAVTDLFTNAAKAGALAPSIAVTRIDASPQTGNQALIRVEVFCDCAALELGDLPEDSSLMRLADAVLARSGTFLIDDLDAGHRFMLTWPAVRPLGNDGGSRGNG